MVCPSSSSAMLLARRESLPPEAAAYSQEIKAFALENMKQLNCDDESDDASFGARAGRRMGGDASAGSARPSMNKCGMPS